MSEEYQIRPGVYVETWSTWELVGGLTPKGNPSKRHRWAFNRGPEYCLIERCELCGCFGNPRYIQWRGDCWAERWRDVWKCGTPRLCMRCWNRLRPIVARIREIEFCKYLVRKLRRAINGDGSDYGNFALAALRRDRGSARGDDGHEQGEVDSAAR